MADIVSRAKFFWCTSHNGNGMWFPTIDDLHSNWKCYKCKAVKLFKDLKGRD